MKQSKQIQGKKNKAKGARFERKVRADLEKDGYVVSKWHNNIDLINNVCIPAKPGRFRMMQTGFPDFIAYRRIEQERRIIFIECKCNGYLKPEEKEKANWYLINNYCSEFLIAKIGEKRGEIIYTRWTK